MNVNFTPRFSGLGLLGAMGKGFLKGLGIGTYLAAAVVVGHDIGSALYNARHPEDKYKKTILVNDYIVKPVADKIKEVRESYDAMDELKARGINVRRRDALATLNAIEYNEALEAFNKNPEEYLKDLDPNVTATMDLDKMTDGQKVLFYNLAKIGKERTSQNGQFVKILTALEQLDANQSIQVEH